VKFQFHVQPVFGYILVLRSLKDAYHQPTVCKSDRGIYNSSHKSQKLDHKHVHYRYVQEAGQRSGYMKEHWTLDQALGLSPCWTVRSLTVWCSKARHFPLTVTLHQGVKTNLC